MKYKYTQKMRDQPKVRRDEERGKLKGRESIPISLTTINVGAPGTQAGWWWERGEPLYTDNELSSVHEGVPNC